MTEFSPTVTAWLERWQALVWETPSAGRAIRLFCEKDTFVLISAIWNTNNSTNKHWNFCRVALFIERFVTLTNHGVFVTMYECLFRRIYKSAIINLQVSIFFRPYHIIEVVTFFWVRVASHWFLLGECGVTSKVWPLSTLTTTRNHSVTGCGETCKFLWYGNTRNLSSWTWRARNRRMLIPLQFCSGLLRLSGVLKCCGHSGALRCFDYVPC